MEDTKTSLAKIDSNIFTLIHICANIPLSVNRIRGRPFHRPHFDSEGDKNGRRIPCPWGYPIGCNCNTCTSDRQAERRAQNRGKTTYGRGSTSGAYGRGSYNFESTTFDGLPALKRHLSGKTEFFYGANAIGEVDIDDIQHGHAVIKNGKLVYKRRPGESSPVVDRR